MIRKYSYLVIILGVPLLLYYPVLTTYFAGDDFFHFVVARTDGEPESFIRLFGFYPFELRGIAFWRPLFREALYNLFYGIFGLSSLPFRVVAIALHLANILLVWKLARRLFKSEPIATLSAFFFGITAANVAILYYLAGGIQAQGATFFMLISVIAMDKYLTVKDRSCSGLYYLSSLAVFVAALASHELSFIAPFLITGLYLLQGRRPDIIRLLPFFLLLTIYAVLNYYVIGFSAGEIQYQLTTSPVTALNTLSWYSAWALGVPEMLIDFVGPGINLNPNLMRYWSGYFWIIFPALALSVIMLGIGVTLSAKQILNKKGIFLALWFTAGLSPVLFLPHHKSSYYLATSLPAFWMGISWIVISAYRKIFRRRYMSKAFIICTIIALTTLSSSSALLGRKTYPAVRRGEIAEKLVADLKEAYPTLPSGAAIYVENDQDYPAINEDWGGTSRQASYILSGNDAARLIYDDPSISVYYEDAGPPPPVVVPFNFTARLGE